MALIDNRKMDAEESVTSISLNDNEIDIVDLDSELESLSCDITLDSFDVDPLAEKDTKKEPSALENQLKKLDTLHEVEVSASASFELSFEDETDSDKATDQKQEMVHNKVDSKPTSSPEDDDGAADPLTSALSILIDELEIDDMRKWFNRVENASLYRLDYRPVPREIREIEQLARNYLPTGRNASKDVLYPYLKPSKDDQQSVLLKREPVIFTKLNSSDEMTEEQSNAIVGHLILLNCCFFIGRDNNSIDNKKGLKGLFKPLLGKEKKQECCHQLASITQVGEFSRASDVQLSSFVIGVNDSAGSMQYKIYCHSEERLKAWLYAFSTAVERNQSIERQSILAKKREENRDKDATTGGAATANMKLNNIMSDFQERGEKLGVMETKSNQLMDQAQNYGQLTKQLKEKLKKKNTNWLGI